MQNELKPAAIRFDIYQYSNLSTIEKKDFTNESGI
jgi:hypothetical protein